MEAIKQKMKERCEQATALRVAARKIESWSLNIDELLKSNEAFFEGTISREDMEACYDYVLDQYDPNYLIEHKYLEEKDYQGYLENFDEDPHYNPFFELLEIDETGKVVDVVLYTTDDREHLAKFLIKKYKYKGK